MSVETFRSRLARGRAQLRREQLHRTWAFLAGVIAAFVALILSGPFLDVGLPSTTDQLAYAAWVLASWMGVCSLLAFGIVYAPPPNLGRAMHAGLWIGAGAVAAGVTMAPLALFLLLLPVAVGASIVRRISGARLMVLYLAVPFFALLGSVIYQRYEASAI